MIENEQIYGEPLPTYYNNVEDYSGMHITDILDLEEPTIIRIDDAGDYANNTVSAKLVFNYGAYKVNYGENVAREKVIIRDYDAENNLMQALTLCEKMAQLGWETLVCGYLGHVYSDMGDYKRAQDYYKEGVSTLERARLYSFGVNMWKVSLARSKVLSNDKNVNLGEVSEYYKNISPKVEKGLSARYIGEILLNDDPYRSEAEDWFKKAIEVDKRNGTMWSLGRGYASYAELFRRRGDVMRAKQKLNKAIEILRECGADGWVKKYEEELASLS